MNVSEASYHNPDKKYMTDEHSVFSCQYHVIFCPKYRRKVLTGSIETRMKELCLETAERFGFAIPDIEVMPDHVHMIISCNPKFGVVQCIHRIKGRTSRILRDEFPELKRKLPTLWSRSYFVSSVGSVSLDVVKKYIEEQKNQ